MEIERILTTNVIETTIATAVKIIAIPIIIGIMTHHDHSHHFYHYHYKN